MFQTFEVTARPEQGPPRLAALREVVREGENALLTPPGDAQDPSALALVRTACVQSVRRHCSALPRPRRAMVYRCTCILPNSSARSMNAARRTGCDPSSGYSTALMWTPGGALCMQPT